MRLSEMQLSGNNQGILSVVQLLCSNVIDDNYRQSCSITATSAAVMSDCGRSSKVIGNISTKFTRISEVFAKNDIVPIRPALPLLPLLWSYFETLSFLSSSVRLQPR